MRSVGVSNETSHTTYYPHGVFTRHPTTARLIRTLALSKTEEVHFWSHSMVLGVTYL